MKLRPAQESDLPALARLMSELSGENMTIEAMRNRLDFITHSLFDSIYVCEDDERVVGTFAFRIRENIESVSRYGEISAIIVEPAERNRGIGRRLMELAETLAREYGCIGTWLVSGFGREEEAHQFYRNLGYETTGYRFRKPS
ncbi:MAG: GNAT family N-acetyltransferase [Chitinophagales bacterium]